MSNDYTEHMAWANETPIPDPDAPAAEDHVVHLRGRWSDYVRLLRMRGERSRPRISYLDGVIEIMSPSIYHEGIKVLVARLIEVWCLERDVEFSGYGSWTIKKEEEEAGAEPDECYVIGDYVKSPKRPDLAIEVVWTGGGIGKLEIYRRLRVREVWFWERGRITPHTLRGRKYVPIPQSELLEGIDLKQLASFVSRQDRSTSSVIRAYRAALTRRRKKR